MANWKAVVRLAVVAGVALVFIGSGAAKLSGAEAMSAVFARFQLPGWFMALTGVIECGAGIGLLTPVRLVRAGAGALLCATMIAGAGFHFVYDPPQAAIPALVLAAVCGWLAWSAWRRAPQRAVA